MVNNESQYPFANAASESLDRVYSPLGDQPYEQVLPLVQSGVAMTLKKPVDELTEQELKTSITQYIREKNVKCSLTKDVTVLINHIYHDMAGASFISRERLLDLPGFEELDINSWDDVEIIVKGEKRKLEYKFLSPTIAIDVIRRYFQKTQTNFDVATPRATTEIGPGVRITAWREPLVDKDVSLAASIRRVSVSTATRDKLVGSSLTDEMMSFLELCLTHGVSMVVSGGTDAGKTTTAGVLLRYAAETKRIITIEEGSREWDLVKHDENGRAINSVVHTKTRPHDDKKLDINQEELVKDALRFNPDIISPGEIRGREAFEVMGVSNTGHTVITTVHANNTMAAPKRIVTLAKMAYDMTDSTLYDMFATAFPLLVHMELCPDGVRRVTEIREVTGYSRGDLKTHLLYEFEVEDNVYEGDSCVKTVGRFCHRDFPSAKLTTQLLKHGAKRSDLDRFMIPKEEAEQS